jgi:hypothetical protein
MSGGSPIIDDSFYEPMINAYNKAGGMRPPVPLQNSYVNILRWMMSYAKTTNDMNDLNNLVAAFWPALTDPSGFGSMEAATLGIASTRGANKASAILSTLEQELKNPTGNTFLRTLGALSNAGAGGAYVIGDVLATNPNPCASAGWSGEVMPDSAATALASSHEPQQEKDRALERLVDGGIHQLVAPCPMSYFPLQFARAVGAHGKRAIPALQQRASYPPGIAYGTADVSAKMAINYLQSLVPGNLLGCYADNDKAPSAGTAGRDLDGAITQSNSLTKAQCVTNCGSQGFGYAGLQFGQWCFCGQSYGKFGFSSGCSMPCAGDPNEICGGSWANSVYDAK